MKKRILFFFVNLLFVAFAHAQDNFEEEFVDPSLQQQPAPEYQAEAQSEPLPIETNSLSDVPASEPIFFSEEKPLKTGEVVLEMQKDLQQSYKQRRGRHGILFSVNYEKFYPVDYFSMYRDVYIEDIIGTDRIDLFGAELGYKINFQLGSIAILANYASGHLAGSVAGAERTLYLNRTGLAVNYAMDNFFEEPWVVPYGQIGVHQFQIEEDDLSKPSAVSKTTSYSLNYRLGLLFQLNWIEKSIDPSTQIDGLRSSGLQNTFLDLYVADHFASTNTYDPANATSDGDPDLASNFEIGVGLKMEF